MNSNKIWYPLTQYNSNNDLSFPKVIKTKGSKIFTNDGKEYIDGISSWYTASFGHGNEYIKEKIINQIEKHNQVVFSSFSHDIAEEFAEKFIKLLPHQHKVFFSDNGSTSVEVALKIATQFYKNQNINKTIILSFENSFHGDTFGAMSISEDSIFNHPFRDMMIEVKKIPLPNEENIYQIIKEIQNYENFEKISCFIYEPLIQGAGGMIMYNSYYLNKLLSFLQDNNIIVIADEVMTGFGKTGRQFASELIETKPDIMCFSKALTGGFLPLGVTTCNANIFDKFIDSDIEKSFFHSHTYTANPISCAAASAVCDLLQSTEINSLIENLSNNQCYYKAKIEKSDSVRNPRVLGTILAFEYMENTDIYSNKRNELYKYFMSKNIFLRPLGNTIYTMPPFVISNQELEEIYDTINNLIFS